MESRESTSPEPSQQPDKLLQFTTAAILLALLVVIFFERYHTRNEPLGRDMASYAVASHEVLQGRKLYTEVFDQKPPAIYWTYMLAEILTGYNRQTIFYLSFVSGWITALGIYVAGAGAFRRPMIGLLAAALYTILSGDMWLQANQPNAEVFMNACLVWAFAMLVQAGDRLLRRREAVAIGLLYALSTLYKPITIAVPGLVFCACILFPPAGSAGRRTSIARTGLMLAALAVPWIVIAAYFGINGRFGDFYYAMVTYNQSYSGSLSANLGEALHLRRLLPESLQFALPFMLIMLLGSVAGVRQRGSFVWVWLWAWVIGTEIAVALPGKFLYHYYQLWLPLLAVGPAWGVHAIQQSTRPQLARLAPWLAAALLILAFHHEWRFYRYTPEQWSQHVMGNFRIISNRLAYSINTLLDPNEVFYDASIDPEMYFFSKRRPPSGIYYYSPTVDGARAIEFGDRLLHDLTRTPPELITTLTGEHINGKVFRWIRHHYDRLPDRLQQYTPYVLWMRHGGTLAKRISRK